MTLASLLIRHQDRDELIPIENCVWPDAQQIVAKRATIGRG
jgi:hypothetical protein